MDGTNERSMHGFVSIHPTPPVTFTRAAEIEALLPLDGRARVGDAGREMQAQQATTVIIAWGVG